MTLHEESQTIEDAKRGTSLAGRWVGSGRWGQNPWVLMVTGDGPKGSRSSGWKNVVPMLNELGIDCYLFDFEGLGDSKGDRSVLTATVAQSNLDAVSSHLAAVMRGKAPYGVYAASFGAYVALRQRSVLRRSSAIVLKSPRYGCQTRI